MSIQHSIIQTPTQKSKEAGTIETVCTQYGELYTTPGQNRHLTRLSVLGARLAGAGTSPTFKLGGGAEQSGGGYLQIYVPIPMRLHAARFITALGNIHMVLVKNATALGTVDSDFAYGTSTAGELPYMLHTTFNLLVPPTVYGGVAEMRLGEGPYTCANGLLIWGTPYIPSIAGLTDATYHKPIKTADAGSLAIEGVIWYEPI